MRCRQKYKYNPVDLSYITRWGICITPCRRCVQNKYTSTAKLCIREYECRCRRCVCSSSEDRAESSHMCPTPGLECNYDSFSCICTAVTNSNSQVDAVFKPLRGRCLQSPSCISSLVRRCRGVSRYRHCVGAPRGELLIPDQTM